MEQVRNLLAQKVIPAEIVRKTGLNALTVYRIRDRMKAESGRSGMPD
jgi:DNA invertase Pin-like site-specific DNA recombinase